jgi:hypothetical protein
MTASTTNPRFAAAATKSALYVFSRRQLMGLSVSNSSDFASDHGQRAGTQSEGCGTEAHNRVVKLNNAAQRTAGICIYHHYTSPEGRSAAKAGGSIRGGKVIGATDEIGFKAVRDPVHTNDIHATILALLGLDHKRLTYFYQGRDFRLTDVGGDNNLAPACCRADCAATALQFKIFEMRLDSCGVRAQD